MPELTRRPLRRTDIPAWLELLAAAEAVDRTGENFDADDLTHEFDDPAVVAESDTLALLDGTRLITCGRVRRARRRRREPTGALRIYERLGFRTEGTATTWACEVSPA